MHFEGHLVFPQQTKAFYPLLIGEVVIVLRLRVLGVVWVVVKHVSYASESLVEGVALQNVVGVRGGEVATSHNG